ncbi:MAG: gliding motility protein GldN [Bacteroidetes bacterium]|jgi:gliding motility associated protien GldN|nr:MAG: gliding motility protein GldN [Bacteroidota bacterium]
MKSIVLKSGFCFLLAVVLVKESDAQRRPTRRGNTQQPATNNPTQQTNNNNRPANYDPYGGLPITVDSSGIADTIIRKSLRNDNAYDKSSINARTPLVYEHLRADDALFAEKVWRELDLREKMNQPFRYEARDDNGSQMFVDILLKAVKTGQVTAFQDDRFSIPMPVNEVELLTSGTADTTPVYSLTDMTKIESYKVTRATFDAKSVTKLRLKEEWVFDRESSRMFCRILGIGVLKTEYIPNTNKERGTSTLFWVYYPDMRPILTKYEVYNPKNMGQSRLTWEELFESRMFSSYITKSTIDNAANRNIRQYIKDPILALLEGDNVKDKIFNYEQDLWSY